MDMKCGGHPDKYIWNRSNVLNSVEWILRN